VEQDEVAPTVPDDVQVKLDHVAAQAASPGEQILSQLQPSGEPTIVEVNITRNNDITPDVQASPRSIVSAPTSPGNSLSNASSTGAQDATEAEAEGKSALGTIAHDAPTANTSFKEESQAESQYFDFYPAVEDYHKENGAKALQVINAARPQSFVTIENIDD
jgi:hypothetical protein